MKLQATLLLVALSATLAGCKDLTFGDTAQGYLVNGDAVDKANKFIRLDLENRWNNAFRLFFNAQLARHEHLTKLTAAVDIPRPDDDVVLEGLTENTLKVEIKKLFNMKNLVRGVQNELQSLSDGQRQFNQICSNRGYIRSWKLDDRFIAHFASMGFPDYNDIFVYKLHTDLGQNIGTLVETFGFFSGKKEFKKQKKKFDDAMHHFRSRVIRGERFYALSEKICAVNWSRFDQSYSSLVSTTETLSEHVDSKINKMNLTILLHHTHLTPLIYSRVEDIFGIHNLLARFEEEGFYLEMHSALAQTRNEVTQRLTELAFLDAPELASKTGRQKIDATQAAVIDTVMSLKRLLKLDIRLPDRDILQLSLAHFLEVLEHLGDIKESARGEVSS